MGKVRELQAAVRYIATINNGRDFPNLGMQQMPEDKIRTPLPNDSRQ